MSETLPTEPSPVITAPPVTLTPPMKIESPIGDSIPAFTNETSPVIMTPPIVMGQPIVLEPPLVLEPPIVLEPPLVSADAVPAGVVASDTVAARIPVRLPPRSPVVVLVPVPLATAPAPVAPVAPLVITPTFPVLTVSGYQLNMKAFARGLIALGQLILAVNLGLGQMLPALRVLMPKTLWIGPLIACIGGVAASVDYLMDKTRIKEANNSNVAVIVTKEIQGI